MRTPKGTRDLLSSEIVYFQAIEQRALAHFGKYGFHEIRTPIFEDTALFLRGIGEGTDIVNKEMYTFSDKGGRSITLRPELTAPVCRAVVQHHLVKPGDVVRLLYMGPLFRYERPQEGRYRQFHQLGAEVFGSADPLVDVETLEALWQFLQPFELPNLKLAINSVGDGSDRPAYLAYLRDALETRTDVLCGDCQQRLSKNVLRILDCKKPRCREEVLSLKPISAFWSEENRRHFDAVCAGLDRLNVPFTVDHLLVRGLDYYTKTAFELLSGDLGAQSAVMGGGRYDDLISLLGGKHTPAFGWALGIDRLATLMAKFHPLEPAHPAVFFIFGKREWLEESLPLIRSLRQQGFWVSYDLRCGSMKSQMKRANRERAAFSAIVGDEEYQQGMVSLKNMATSAQTQLSRGALAAKLAEEMAHA